VDAHFSEHEKNRAARAQAVASPMMMDIEEPGAPLDIEE